MIVAGTDGPIVTPIKALLTPNKMQESEISQVAEIDSIRSTVISSQNALPAS